LFILVLMNVFSHCVSHLLFEITSCSGCGVAGVSGALAFLLSVVGAHLEDVTLAILKVFLISIIMCKLFHHLWTFIFGDDMTISI
jgi:hypothetical protein